MFQIQDDFFEKEEFEKIKQYVTTQLFYTPRWFDGQERDEFSFYGSRCLLESDSLLYKLFVEQVEKKFKIKINKVHKDSGLDIRNLKHLRVHRDVCKLNVFIMISGPQEFNNGTVFFGHKGNIEDNPNVDMQIGFKENRALVYNSDYIHSPCVSPTPDIRRFTASLFVEDYRLT